MSREADFSLNELFFSKTDFNGRILASNKVFLRVSEFVDQEIHLKPHNVIRHADMPRSVFKLFWSYLQAGKPVAAFVKNRSKSGLYYWVFAMAFPMDDGYVSIRIKPSSDIFIKVKALYQRMVRLEEEGGGGMDSSTEELNSFIRQLEFSSYDDFMKYALLKELSSRDYLLAEQGVQRAEVSESLPLVRHLSETAAQCSYAAKSAFNVVAEINERFSKNKLFDDIKTICRSVQMVTTNLAISSARLGEAGRTLGVVARNLEHLTTDIMDSADRFEKVFSSFRQEVDRMHFNVASSRFQLDMMEQLALETHGQEEESFLLRNCELLYRLIQGNFAETERTSSMLVEEGKKLCLAVGALSRVTAGMDVICVVGRIETVHVGEVNQALYDLLNDMKSLTESFKVSLRALEDESNWGVVRSGEIKRSLLHISQNLKKVDQLVVQ